MIKDDDRIEFIFEKIIQEPTEENPGASVELFVKYDADGPFGPTVSFTEELEPSKRASSDWTNLPLSFIKEIAEHLYSKGAIEELEGSKSSGSSKVSTGLPNPVLAAPKASGGNLNLPQVVSPMPNQDRQRPAPPMQGPPPLNPNFSPNNYGPQVNVGPNGIEVQNSQPPYQQPITNYQMNSQPHQGYQLPNERSGSYQEF